MIIIAKHKQKSIVLSASVHIHNGQRKFEHGKKYIIEECSIRSWENPAPNESISIFPLSYIYDNQCSLLMHCTLHWPKKNKCQHSYYFFSLTCNRVFICRLLWVWRSFLLFRSFLHALCVFSSYKLLVTTSKAILFHINFALGNWLSFMGLCEVQSD